MDEINFVTSYKPIQYFEMPIQGAQAYIPDNPQGSDRKGGCTNDTYAWTDKLKQLRIYSLFVIVPVCGDDDRLPVKFREVF